MAVPTASSLASGHARPSCAFGSRGREEQSQDTPGPGAALTGLAVH